MSGVPVARAGKRSSADIDSEPPSKRVKQFIKEGFVQRATEVGPIHAAAWANEQFALGDSACPRSAQAIAPVLSDLSLHVPRRLLLASLLLILDFSWCSRAGWLVCWGNRGCNAFGCRRPLCGDGVAKRVCCYFSGCEHAGWKECEYSGRGRVMGMVGCQMDDSAEHECGRLFWPLIYFGCGQPCEE